MEALPETLERGIGISLIEVYERGGKSVISVFKIPKRANRCFYDCEKCLEDVLVL